MEAHGLAAEVVFFGGDERRNREPRHPQLVLDQELVALGRARSGSNSSTKRTEASIMRGRSRLPRASGVIAHVRESPLDYNARVGSP